MAKNGENSKSGQGRNKYGIHWKRLKQLAKMEVETMDSIRFPKEDELLHLLQWEANKRKPQEVEGLEAFIHRVSPKFVAKYGGLPPHMLQIIEILERARTERVFACISMPPRHGKSFTVTHGIVWLLTHNPDLLCCYASYGDDLARTQSRYGRELALEAGLHLSKESASVSDWRIEGHRGGLIATSIGGVLTGKGIPGWLIIDDPFKDRENADSLLGRNKVWEWFTSVGDSRMEGNSSIIVVQTRWHDDDLIGRLSESEARNWEVINIPAIGDDGKALWEEQVPLEELLIKQRQDEFNFAALYQGQPRPRGNAIFRTPARYSMPHSEAEWSEFLRGKKLIVAADPAATAKTSADFSVGLALAVDASGPMCNSWVLDIRRMQAETPKVVEMLVQMQKTWGSAVAIEAIGGFKSTAQYLRLVDQELRVIELGHKYVQRDKYQRAMGVASAWNDGRVFIPTAAPWVDAFLKELQAFTGVGDVHDDQVDALAHAWNVLTQKTTSYRGAVKSSGPFM